jgi:hypothetical protein
MKHRLSFFLFFAVCVHAQDAAKPTVQQPEHGVANYYGAYTPGAEPTFNHNPNAFLAECVRNRTPGKVLMAANKGATFAVPAGARLPMLNGGDGPLSGRAN